MKGQPGKAPAFQFYVKDWLSDTQLRMASCSTKGMWIDLLCHMFEDGGNGIFCVSEYEIKKLTGATDDDVKKFISEADRYKFCDLNVTGNGMLEICNRRIFRERKAREDNRLRVQKWRERHRSNDNVTEQKGGAPSSSSISTPIAGNKKGKNYPKNISKEKRRQINNAVESQEWLDGQ